MMESYLKKQLTIVACVYFGDLSVGYVTWASPVIPKLQDPQQTPLSDVISDREGSWMGASSYPGVLLGATLTGWFSNTYGRKSGMLLGGILFMTSYSLLATIEQFWMLIVGRTLNGIGAGIICVTNITYIAEISSTHIRGFLLTASGFFMCLGILAAFAVGPFVSYIGVMYIGFFLAMIFCVIILFIPETPSFYVLKGKEIEAKTTLVALGRSEDIEEILSSKPQKVKSRIQGLKDVFFIKTNRKALMISLVIFICQGMSGFIIILLYITPIFQSVNSSIDPGLATIIVGVMQLVSSCLTPLFIERTGRKTLMIISTAGCSLSMVVLGIYFLLQNEGKASARQLHWVTLASVVLFLISHQTVFTIPGACCNEMFDSSARGPGFSLVFFTGGVVCFVVTVAFGYISSTFGSYVIFLLHIQKKNIVKSTGKSCEIGAVIVRLLAQQP